MSTLKHVTESMILNANVSTTKMEEFDILRNLLVHFFCRELHEKVDTTLMSNAKFEATTRSWLA